MAKTKISWAQSVWNPTTGCSKISTGCRACYAEPMALRLQKMGQKKYADAFEPRFHYDALDLPLNIRKPTRFFVNSMSDLFHQSFTSEQIAAVFGVMAACPQHTFIVLTKRAERMRGWFEWANEDECAENAAIAMGDSFSSMCYTAPGRAWPLPNVWIGVSVEDHKAASERIPRLIETPAAVRFLSCEPLLEAIDLEQFLFGSVANTSMHYDRNGKLCGSGRGGQAICSKPLNAIHWVIAGCESGPKRRSCNHEWVREIVEQTRLSNVACFVKQLEIDGKVTDDPAKFPEWARVQEFPQ